MSIDANIPAILESSAQIAEWSTGGAKRLPRVVGVGRGIDRRKRKINRALRNGIAYLEEGAKQLRSLACQHDGHVQIDKLPNQARVVLVLSKAPNQKLQIETDSNGCISWSNVFDAWPGPDKQLSESEIYTILGWDQLELVKHLERILHNRKVVD